MRKFILLFALFAITQCQDDVNIEELLASLSVEEKCGQMTQVTFEVISKYGGPDFADQWLDTTEAKDPNPVDIIKLQRAIHEKKVGSILNTPFDQAQSGSTWQLIIKTVQDEALKTKNKIPVLYGIDSIHGANYVREATLFPQPLSMAATFNLTIAEKVGAITAMETKAAGIPWNFNPVLDVGREALWPRIYETYGEDVHVAKEMGSAYIHGLEGNDVSDRQKVVACLKHYVGYSTPLNGRDRSASWIPEIILREYFLPPFKMGVDMGVQTVMINSGDVNGIPGHGNRYYIEEILKKEMGFEGFTVSDWQDIQRLEWRDKVAENGEEAVRLGVMSGVDMSMVPFDFSFHDHCVALHAKDHAFAARVEDATRRILKVKKLAGLFRNNGTASYPVADDLKNLGTDESNAFNLDAARESIILGTNNGILPLDKTENMSILVTGPTANLMKVLNGGWSYQWQGSNEGWFYKFGEADKRTVYEAINHGYPNVNVTWSQGSDFWNLQNINETIEAAIESDYIVLCIGEDTYTESLGNIDDLRISQAQIDLAERLYEVGKPIIVVYLGGRPRVITQIVEKADAVVLGFLPGNKGGVAISEVLFGDVNPSGKLPITYPRNTNGQTKYDKRPLDGFDFNENEQLYAFGHGLSYTRFKYSDLLLSDRSIDANTPLEVSIKVRNIGDRAGKETVILYVNDHFASISRPIRQVKGFKKIHLEKDEEKTVSFTLNYDDYTYINQDLERVADAGKFTIYINSNSGFNTTFTLTEARTTTTHAPETTTTPKTTAKPTPKTTSKASSVFSFNSFFRIEFSLIVFLVSIAKLF